MTGMTTWGSLSIIEVEEGAEIKDSNGRKLIVTDCETVIQGGRIYCTKKVVDLLLSKSRDTAALTRGG